MVIKFGLASSIVFFSLCRAELPQGTVSVLTSVGHKDGAGQIGVHPMIRHKDEDVEIKAFRKRLVKVISSLCNH